MRNRWLSLLLAVLTLAPAAALAQGPITSIGATLQNAATATGAGSTLDTSRSSVVTFQVSGTFVASVQLQGSLDGTNWTTLTCYDPTSGNPVGTVSSTGLWKCNVNGIPAVRANISAFTSGSVTVVANATNSPLAIRDIPSGVSAPNVYSQTFNPTAITTSGCVAPGGVFCGGQEQTFTVTGLALGQSVFVNGPAPTAACPPAGTARVSAANTLSMTFETLTTATCTPATGTYTIVAANPGGATAGLVYVQTFNPTAQVACAGGGNGVFCGGVEQTFTVTGLTTANRVFVSGPAPTAACPPVAWRVSSGNTLSGTFAYLTTATCTPATGTYTIVAY